ncbi:hypothetical protein G7Y89_g12551 [Cudoniella acicularis]|uniref:Uncharacterized protein n=1 Tax=Cudoniella acicularis TaxID=354080 RepID=A0A8H4RBB0_9HELO|nr:hypothetical protein G7Y89_g12551 [Cudoniella acicularis]
MKPPSAWDEQPADAEEDLEDEDEGCGGVGGGACPDAQEDGDEREAEEEARGAKHEEGASAEALYGPEGNEGGGETTGA